ncbi:hypothetical protein [Streptomyces mirabilis]|uniref:hypothetical protein n=1 Tax=Streptomyces mirabilis TaxID=68239 RepID=UPI0022592412|nr:hypothetical protein [Streptomyces mirabilis]MCX4418514.1 hypothetical protein [Streptomyces mirabilis]
MSRMVAAAVEVGGVDVVDAEFKGTAEHRAAGFEVAGLAAHAALGRQAHRTEPQTVDGEVAAEAEFAGHATPSIPYRGWFRTAEPPARPPAHQVIRMLAVGALQRPPPQWPRSPLIT